MIKYQFPKLVFTHAENHRILNKKKVEDQISHFFLLQLVLILYS